MKCVVTSRTQAASSEATSPELTKERRLGGLKPHTDESKFASHFCCSFAASSKSNFLLRVRKEREECSVNIANQLTNCKFQFVSQPNPLPHISFQFQKHPKKQETISAIPGFLPDSGTCSSCCRLCCIKTLPASTLLQESFGKDSKKENFSYYAALENIHFSCSREYTKCCQHNGAHGMMKILHKTFLIGCWCLPELC